MQSVVIDLNQDVAWISTSDVQLLEALTAFVAGREINSDADRLELSVSLVSDQVMRDLHEQYFDDDSETDIITFPGDTPNELGEFLGDLVICGDVASVQAVEAQHSFKREIAFLLVHGLLHIAGWVDADPEQRTAMLRRQEELVLAFESSHGVRF